MSRGTEAGNVTVFHSSDHTFSAAVAKFHHHATITIFATSMYHLFINTNFFFKLLSLSSFFVFFLVAPRGLRDLNSLTRD